LIHSLEWLVSFGVEENETEDGDLFGVCERF
jgi:hypothetical protein